MMVKLANLMGEIRQASVGSVAVNVIRHSGSPRVIGRAFGGKLAEASAEKRGNSVPTWSHF